MLGKYIHLPTLFIFSGNAISRLLGYYRSTFPTGNVFPKLYILKCHVLERVQQFQRGLGLFSEQGIESIHYWLNDSLHNYHSLPCDDCKKV